MNKIVSKYAILILLMIGTHQLLATIETKIIEKAAVVQISETLSNKTPLSISDYEKQLGRKMTFSERIKFKIAQKWAKKISKAGEKSDKKTLSLMSLIFGASSFIVIWIVPLVGLLLSIAGIIFGIVALKKENAKTMAILGIVFGGILVLLTLLLMAVLASFSFV